MAHRRRRVVWTDQARFALDEILSYIARDSPRAARRMLEEVLGAAQSLATLSERGRVVPELEEPTVRELVIGNYRLLYQVKPTTVSILAMVHGARDFLKWRESE